MIDDAFTADEFGKELADKIIPYGLMYDFTSHDLDQLFRNQMRETERLLSDAGAESREIDYLMKAISVGFYREAAQLAALISHEAGHA